MKKGLLGEKVGMTQVWTEAGRVEVVTAIQLGPCSITQVKTPERDGYSAVQIGYNEIKDTSLTKAAKGHQKASFEKANIYYRVLKEIRNYEGDAQEGDILSCDIFSQGDKVIVQGKSKGKGFQGVVKRYNFRGGRATHGSHFHRSPGSVGAGTDPGRVAKGKKMPGRMGGKTATTMHLVVVKVLPDENIVLIRGSVPGPNGSQVFVYQN
ncbi:MAG: 50S ribosomal protein L3 [Leptospirales bacterium]